MAKIQWIPQGNHLFPELHKLADIINQLLKRDPPPRDLDKPLPTPTPAAWEGIGRSLDLAFKCDHFYDKIELTTHNATSLNRSEVAIKQLHVALLEMPYHLVAGHLPNLDLDVTKIMWWVIPMTACCC